MSGTTTYTRATTNTYTTTDVEDVLRKMRADFNMIGQSTGAISASKIDDYMHDISLLAVNGFLRKVDITQLKYGIEYKAVQYTFQQIESPRDTDYPGGVVWPADPFSDIRVILSYDDSYTPQQIEKLKEQLVIPWVPVDVDLDHSTLTHSGGREFTSNNFAAIRKDFNQ